MEWLVENLNHRVCLVDSVGSHAEAWYLSCEPYAVQLTLSISLDIPRWHTLANDRLPLGA